jgi:hypothetical protein
MIENRPVTYMRCNYASRTDRALPAPWPFATPFAAPSPSASCSPPSRACSSRPLRPGPRTRHLLESCPLTSCQLVALCELFWLRRMRFRRGNPMRNVRGRKAGRRPISACLHPGTTTLHELFLRASMTARYGEEFNCRLLTSQFASRAPRRRPPA